MQSYTLGCSGTSTSVRLPASGVMHRQQLPDAASRVVRWTSCSALSAVGKPLKLSCASTFTPSIFTMHLPGCMPLTVLTSVRGTTPSPTSRQTPCRQAIVACCDPPCISSNFFGGLTARFDLSPVILIASKMPGCTWMPRAPYQRCSPVHCCKPAP